MHSHHHAFTRLYSHLPLAPTSIHTWHQVVVDEGMNTVSYELNEALISFSTAVDEGDLKGACAMLER